MAHLTDQRGNPIQLTDELGNPVTLTDELGNPMQLSGVAYSATEATAYAPASSTTMGDVLSGPNPGPTPLGQQQAMRVEEVGAYPPLVRRSTTSGSSSSEEDVGGEEGGAGTRRRRQKKGITEKLKEKLKMSGGGSKDTTATTTGTPHQIATTDMATQKVRLDHIEKEKGGVFVEEDTTTTTLTTEHKDQPKKGVFEKILDKLPGHH